MPTARHNIARGDGVRLRSGQTQERLASTLQSVLLGAAGLTGNRKDPIFIRRNVEVKHRFCVSLTRSAFRASSQIALRGIQVDRVANSDTSFIGKAFFVNRMIWQRKSMSAGR